VAKPFSKDDSGSHHLIDPEIQPMIEAFPPILLGLDTLQAFRERPVPQAPLSDAARAVTVTPRTIPGACGAPPTRVAIYRQSSVSGPVPIILHIHGGGYVAGSVEISQGRQQELAAALGCAVVSVGYRLAPEAVFPAAVEDCYAALAWAIGSGTEFGGDPARLAIKGESAGGGLAAALALLARDRGEFTPVLQHLTYPMLDDRTATSRPASSFAGEFIWTAANNRFGWQSLLGQALGGPDVSPYAAPARANDLTGLPPTYLMTGALDLFADEGIDYARRLVAAGVPTELHVFPGGCHGFDLVPDAAIAKAARASGLAALARAFDTKGERA
jgi:acetyl esterase/lipase